MLFRSSPRRALPLLLSLRLLLALVAPILLAACGDLPEPFLGNPGTVARGLAKPPTPMLAVPPAPPAVTMLSPRAGRDFADALARDLRNEEVPTLARAPEKTDWRLAVSADRKGDQVVPRYAILDPSGHEQGAIAGTPLPAASWTAGAPWTLGQAAQDAVPKVLALMMSIRATRDRANPNSLLNRPAVLFVPEVTGAPGDGNPALTRLIRARLAEFGPLVQVTPEGADFTIKGDVIVTPLPNARQQVEIAWTVTRPSGVVVGKVSQLNSVAAGSLSLMWGDVAGVVAQEASSGINTVVERFIGRDATAPGKGTVTSGSTAPSTGPVPGAGDVPGNISVPGAGGVANGVLGKGAGPGVSTAPVVSAIPGTSATPGERGPASGTTAPAAGTALSGSAVPGKSTVLGEGAITGGGTAPGAGAIPLGRALPGNGAVPGVGAPAPVRKAASNHRAYSDKPAVARKAGVSSEDTVPGAETSQGAVPAQAAPARPAKPAAN